VANSSGVFIELVRQCVPGLLEGEASGESAGIISTAV
jgi:hypothetical protein